MGDITTYWAAHVNLAIGVHFFSGLGIAWLVSLAWHRSRIALVLGIVCLLVGIIGRVYAQIDM